MNLEDLKSKLTQALQEGVIYNAEYTWLKSKLNQIIYDEYREIVHSCSRDFYQNNVSNSAKEIFDKLFIYGVYSVGSVSLKLKSKKVPGGKPFDDLRSLVTKWEPVYNTLQALKPLVKKGKKPSDTPHKTLPRTLENTGTCGVCKLNVKLKSGKIVDHGFVVRGYRSGRCFGVGYEPWEISSKSAKDYLTVLVSRLEQKKYFLAQLKLGEIVTLVYRDKVIKSDSPNWDRVWSQAVSQTEIKIQRLEWDIKQFSEAIRLWQPTSLPNSQAL